MATHVFNVGCATCSVESHDIYHTSRNLLLKNTKGLGCNGIKVSVKCNERNKKVVFKDNASTSVNLYNTIKARIFQATERDKKA